MSKKERADWQPTRFVRFIRGLDTSMSTAEVMTDAGRAYIKAMGNREGPHPLACEWVGTKLARWFALPTFDFALLTLDKSDEIPFQQGGHAHPGPAFVTRAQKGHSWGGGDRELELVDNPETVARLPVFDTWTQNCDRHAPHLEKPRTNYDNVFLTEDQAPKGRFRLVAMDHTHCFTCGRNLNERVATIGRIKEEAVYGLFPGFEKYVREQRREVTRAVDQLRQFNSSTCKTIVDSIPPAWDVSQEARVALQKLICRRAAFVADKMIGWLAPKCWPQEEFDFEAKGGGP